MATFTLKQLLDGTTTTEAYNEILTLLQDQNIDTTSWIVGSFARSVLELMAELEVKNAAKATAIASGTLNSLATGDDLTFLADSYFDNQRSLSTQTEGQMIVSASVDTFSLPRTFNAGDLLITDGTVTFQNIEQINLTSVTNIITSSFRAVEAGADYNIPTSSSLSTVNTEIGLEITNPAQIGLNTWISITGTDQEEDEPLRQRNALKWTSLQATGSTVDRAKAIVLNAAPNVFYVAVDAQNQTRGEFTVDVYISRQSTTASAADLELANQALTQIGFNNDTNYYVSASNATEIQFSSSVDIYYSPSVNLASLRESVYSASTDFVNSIPIGGKSYIPFSALSNIAPIDDYIDRIRNISGVRKINITPNEDLTFQISEKLTKPSDWGTVINFYKLANY